MLDDSRAGILRHLLDQPRTHQLFRAPVQLRVPLRFIRSRQRRRQHSRRPFLIRGRPNFFTLQRSHLFDRRESAVRLQNRSQSIKRKQLVSMRHHERLANLRSNGRQIRNLHRRQFLQRRRHRCPANGNIPVSRFRRQPSRIFFGFRHQTINEYRRPTPNFLNHFTHSVRAEHHNGLRFAHVRDLLHRTRLKNSIARIPNQKTIPDLLRRRTDSESISQNCSTFLHAFQKCDSSGAEYFTDISGVSIFFCPRCSDSTPNKVIPDVSKVRSAGYAACPSITIRSM